MFGLQHRYDVRYYVSLAREEHCIVGLHAGRVPDWFEELILEVFEDDFALHSRERRPVGFVSLFKERLVSQGLSSSVELF